MDELKKYLETRLGIQGWKLLVVEPLFEILGDFGSQTEAAFETAIKAVAAEEIPPELSLQGLKGIGAYCSDRGYEYMREFLLEAAQRVAAK